MSVTSKENLITKLERSKAYREAYVIEHVKTGLPLQMRHLREERRLTQAQLAELAKTTQTVISRLEDPNYGNLTLNSLLKIAAGLDMGLLVKFVPFSKLLAEFEDLSPQALSVQSFNEELATLKAWMSMAKNRLPKPGRSINSSGLKETYPLSPSTNITEVIHYSEIQIQLIDSQLRQQLPTQITVTVSAFVNVPDVPLMFNNKMRASGSVTTIAATQTIDWASLGQSRSDDRQYLSV